jgi:hypothetical protein
LQIEQVWGVCVADKTVTPSRLPSTGGTTNTVNKDLRLGWEIIVDHVGENGNINTTGSDIGDNKDVRNAPSEILNLYSRGH